MRPEAAKKHRITEGLSSGKPEETDARKRPTNLFGLKTR